MTLSEFLTARLEEDEVAAQRAYDEASDYRVVGSYLAEDHFARWKPDRVLADVDAKRRIVAHAEEWSETLHHTAPGRSEAGNTGYRMAMDWTLCHLALPYADHPDYLEEWKP